VPRHHTFRLQIYEKVGMPRSIISSVTEGFILYTFETGLKTLLDSHSQRLLHFSSTFSIRIVVAAAAKYYVVYPEK